MSLFQCLILKKVEWRHTRFFSFDVNEILFSSSYKKIGEILGKQFGESSHLKAVTFTNKTEGVLLLLGCVSMHNQCNIENYEWILIKLAANSQH